jgi:polyphosphate kinase 2
MSKRDSEAVRKTAGDKSAERGGEPKPKRLTQSRYEKELLRLDLELVKLQEWVRKKGLKVVVLFEGRGAAGKGGTIKRITTPLNSRVVRVAALPVPTERQRTQWYFQRYVAQLPAAGEIVLFDRSWYNRAGVEQVMGFASPEQVEQFFLDCPEFERMLIRSGIVLVKYWFSISDEEQDRRLQARLNDPLKRWKFSDMDLEDRTRWEAYSRAKDQMMKLTDTPDSPWWIVDAEDKKRARLNCITHLLTRVPYENVIEPCEELPARKESSEGYVRVPMDTERFIPACF